MSNLFRKKVAVYCFIQTKDNNGISSASASHDLLTKQKESLIKFADQNGWQIYDFYIDFIDSSENEHDKNILPSSLIYRTENDNDMSEDMTRYPEFERLCLDAKAHLFDIVLCDSLSCFSRNKDSSLRIIDHDFPKWGVRFLGISDFNHDYDHNLDGEINYSVDNQVLCLKKNIKIKEWYLEDMSEQIEQIQATSVSESDFDYIPFGYRIDTEKSTHLLIEKNEAKVVKFIFSIFSEGLSTREIAACLNDSRIPAPPAYRMSADTIYTAPCNSREWNEGTIFSILRNDFYHNVTESDQTYHPIITDALWKCVQNQLAHTNESTSHPTMNHSINHTINHTANYSELNADKSFVIPS